MGLHPQGERLHAAEREVAVHRARDGARRVHEERQAFAEFVVARHERAADQVRVSAEVLRHRMQHDVRAELERLLQVRRRERVVHDAPRARLVREVRHGGDVDHLEERVGGGLDPHERRVLPYDRTARDQVRHVHRVELEAPLVHDTGEQPVGPAVHVVRDQDVVPRLQRQQQRRRRAEPARETQALRAALERGEHLLQRLPRRVAGAGVVPRLRLADRRLCVRRGLVDRDVDRAELGVGVLADVDRPRLEPHRVLAHRAPRSLIASLIASPAGSPTCAVAARRPRPAPAARGPTAPTSAWRRAQGRTRDR